MEANTFQNMAGDDDDDNGDDDHKDDEHDTMMTRPHNSDHYGGYDKKSLEATYNLLPQTPAKPWVDNNDENHKTIFKLGRKSYTKKLLPSFDQSIISEKPSREHIAFCLERGIYAHIHSLFLHDHHWQEVSRIKL